MNENNLDTGALRRMLRELADMAEDASLTGGLASAAPRAIQRYNGILRHLQDSGAVPRGMFEELNPETTDFSQLAVDAKLLASYIKGQGDSNGGSDASILIRLAPFVNSGDLAELVRDHVAKGVEISERTLTALAPFLNSDQLGTLVREHLISRPTAAPSAPTPPSPPSPPTPPSSPGETLEELAAKLRQPELSREERDRIAERIAEIAARR